MFHYLGVLPDMQAIYKLLLPEHQYKPGSLEVVKVTNMYQIVDPTPDVPYVSPSHLHVMSGAFSGGVFAAEPRSSRPGLHTEDPPRAPREAWYHRRGRDRTPRIQGGRRGSHRYLGQAPGRRGNNRDCSAPLPRGDRRRKECVMCNSQFILQLTFD